MTTRRRMFKKKELIPDRPESVLPLVVALGQFVLIVIGIIGLTAAIFREDGLLASAADRLLSVDAVSLLITLAVAGVALYFIHRRLERRYEKSVARFYGTLATYAMMALGAYYLIRYLLGY